MAMIMTDDGNLGTGTMLIDVNPVRYQARAAWSETRDILCVTHGPDSEYVSALTQKLPALK